MAPRKKTATSSKSKVPASSNRRWLGFFVTLALGVVGGYVWRSYAPLPLPGDTRLTSDASPAITEHLDIERRAAEKMARIQDELDHLKEMQSEKEEEIADIQIKKILGEGI